MTEANPNRLINSWEVAYLLGFKANPNKPRRKRGERSEKDDGMKDFYFALHKGQVPPPDRRIGRSLRWKASTIDAFNQSKTGDSKLTATKRGVA